MEIVYTNTKRWHKQSQGKDSRFISSQHDITLETMSFVNPRHSRIERLHAVQSLQIVCKKIDTVNKLDILDASLLIIHSSFSNLVYKI